MSKSKPKSKAVLNSTVTRLSAEIEKLKKRELDILWCLNRAIDYIKERPIGP